MENMRQDMEIPKFISDSNSSVKTIASICNVAQLLISLKLLQGRKISGYYSIKDDTNNSGAVYKDETYVVDGNIVTTAHYIKILVFG